VGAVLLYGGELWGGCSKRCGPIQTIMNQGLRMLMGARMGSKGPVMSAVWRELACPPVAASALARRCRAFMKFGSLATWVATLVTHHKLARNARKGSWVLSSATLMTRNEVERLELPSGQLEPLQSVVDRTRLTAWERLESGTPSRPTAKATTFYNKYDLAGTRLSRSGFVWLPAYGRELAFLLRARVGGIMTGNRLRHLRGEGGAADAAPADPNKCEYCGGPAETLSHMIVDCPRWAGLRFRLLRRMIADSRDALEHARVPITSDSVLGLLLGGGVNGIRLHGWDHLRDLQADTASCLSDDTSSAGGSSTSSHSPVGTMHKGAYLVSEFICAVVKSRNIG
jgi:hypothetical protein